MPSVGTRAVVAIPGAQGMWMSHSYTKRMLSAYNCCWQPPDFSENNQWVWRQKLTLQDHISLWNTSVQHSGALRFPTLFHCQCRINFILYCFHCRITTTSRRAMSSWVPKESWCKQSINLVLFHCHLPCWFLRKVASTSTGRPTRISEALLKYKLKIHLFFNLRDTGRALCGSNVFVPDHPGSKDRLKQKTCSTVEIH